MKFFVIKFLISVGVLCAALVAGMAYYGYSAYTTPASNAVEKIVMLPKGTGSQAIAERLKAAQVISDPYVFVVAAKILPPSATLKAGEYQFPPHVRMADVLAKLKSGDIYKRQFTIPEGLTSFEILEKLRHVPDLVMGDAVPPAEGSVLPDTYQYTGGDTAAAKLDQMQAALRDVMAKEWPNRDLDLPFATENEALTLASIVEKETGVASERARIAGVFINRLRKGMPLQSDPTVIYALTNGQPQNDGQGPLGRRLLSKDLEIDSPYNTYLHAGLPPAPIANAGKDAVRAVLHPEAHDFLYFVADGTGGHVFARTLAEHNQNVAKWRLTRHVQERVQQNVQEKETLSSGKD